MQNYGIKPWNRNLHPTNLRCKTDLCQLASVYSSYSHGSSHRGAQMPKPQRQSVEPISGHAGAGRSFWRI